MTHEDKLGATWSADGSTRFLVWAPSAEQVDVRIVAPIQATVRLERAADGYHRGVVDGIGPDARYVYRLD